MGIFGREAVESLIVMIAAVLLYGGLHGLPFWGFIEKYPYIQLGVAALLVLFRNNIARYIS